MKGHPQGEGAKIARIAKIAKDRRDWKGKTLPLINTDDADQKGHMQECLCLTSHAIAGDVSAKFLFSGDEAEGDGPRGGPDRRDRT